MCRLIVYNSVVLLAVGCSFERPERIVSGDNARPPAAVVIEPGPTTGSSGSISSSGSPTPAPTAAPTTTPRPTATATPTPTPTPTSTATPAPPTTPTTSPTTSLDPAVVYPAASPRASTAKLGIRLLPVCLPLGDLGERWESAANPILTIEANRLNIPVLAGVLGGVARKTVLMGAAELKNLPLDPVVGTRPDMTFGWGDLFGRLPVEPGALWLVTITVCDDRGHVGRCAGPDARRLVPRLALRQPSLFGLPLVVIPVNGCR